MNLIVIPSDPAEAIYEVRTTSDSFYNTVSGIVGGMIEALPFDQYHPRATAYINEEGKFLPECEPNPRATALVNLFPGDYIAGPLVISGINWETGESETAPFTLAEVEEGLER